MNELSALLTQAAFAPLPDTGWLRVTGSDRVRWLNGMVTNSIQALTPGEGNYSFLLNAQGRIQGDLTAFLEAEAILIETGQPGAVATYLDHYIIMDDVELEVLTSTRAESERPHDNRGATYGRAGLLLAGPQGAEALSALGLTVPDPLRLEHSSFSGHPVDVLAAFSPLIPRFQLWATSEVVDSIQRALLMKDVARVTPEALEHLRLLEGTPLYGTDIRNTDAAKDLPQETNQARALHFSKGCYLGQEIVERIRSRGQVHKTFSGFVLTGDLPTPGAALESEGKAVGELTSVAALDHPVAGPVRLALGYVRREALERNGLITYAGGVARPSPLPFHLPATG